MSIIILLIIFSIVIAIVFLVAFIWAVKKGQFDDTDTPAIRMLFEDKKKKINSKEEDKSGEQ